MLKVKNLLYNTAIKTKLLVLVISFAVFMVTIGVLSVTSIKSINDNANEMYSVNMMTNEYLGKLIENNVRIQKYEVEYVLSDYNMDGEEVKNNMLAVIDTTNGIYNELKQLQNSDDITEKFTLHEEYIAKATKEREAVEERLESGKRLEAYMFFQNRLSVAREDIINVLNEMKQISLE